MTDAPDEAPAIVSKEDEETDWWQEIEDLAYCLDGKAIRPRGVRLFARACQRGARRDSLRRCYIPAMEPLSEKASWPGRRLRSCARRRKSRAGGAY
jgi:hypothetical protein